MNEARRDEIIVTVLASLRLCPNAQCSVNILKPAVDMQLATSTLGSEFADAIRHAEAQGWVVGIRPPLGSVRWQLTDAGQGVLLNARPN